MIFFYCLYLSACTIMFVFGVRALYKMTKRCSHARRIAFVLSTAGSVTAFAEAFIAERPMVSALMIAIGVAILHVVGSREIGRLYVFAKKH